ncbi:MAG: hypothetical protein ABI604_17220, partial [Nitrospirota bacterium]
GAGVLKKLRDGLSTILLSSKTLPLIFTSSGSVHQLNYHLACIHQAFQRAVGFSKEIIGFIVVIPQVTLDLVKVL